MIKKIIKSTKEIFNFFFQNLLKKQPLKKVITNESTEQLEEKSLSLQKDKILFQPNFLMVRNHVEFPCSKNTIINTKPETANEHKEDIHKLTLECNEAAINHLDGLCRFFEINHFEAIARGIWLLSLARDIEINNKKLGIVSVDQNGLIVDIVPINIV